MPEKTDNYRKYIFIALVIIALGVTLSTSLKQEVGRLGAVFIAVGGLFFIIGMSKKKVKKIN